MLVQFFTLIGILCAVSVLVYLIRGRSEESATRVSSADEAVPDNEAGVSDVEQADRIRQLLAAAAAGDTGRVKTLLEAGTSVNSKNESAQTPLMQAAANGHASLVSTLILLGADPNEQDRFGQTALMLAVSFRHEPVRKAIEKLEEFSQIKDPEERQAKLKSLPGLDKRLTAGLELDVENIEIDPLAQDHDGESVLMKALSIKNFAYLRDAQYDFRAIALQDNQGRTPLMYAIETGDLEFLNRLKEMDQSEFYFDELNQVAIDDFQLNPFFDPRSLSKLNREGLTALQLAESLSQQELSAAIREELQRFIQRATQAIESGNESPESLSQFFKFRGQAYLALGDEEKAKSDFELADMPR
jgi:ankyrin repeat protein